MKFDVKGSPQVSHQSLRIGLRKSQLGGLAVRHIDLHVESKRDWDGKNGGN
jgi:hypothetical protein